MSTTLMPPSADDDLDDETHHLSPKKERRIEPTTNGELPAPIEIPGANDDLLEELRRKTAELAGKLNDDNKPDDKTAAKNDTTNPDTFLKELEEKDLVLKNTQNGKSESAASTRSGTSEDANPAAALVREKLSRIYRTEPDAEEEAIEAYDAGKNRSKHQQFMYDLTTSGKSLADIQTEWHNYYTELPEEEKHDVWQEFYSAQSNVATVRKEVLKRAEAHKTDNIEPKTAHSNPDKTHTKPSLRKPTDPRTTGEIKNQIIDKISAGGKLNAVHHFKSLLFGAGMSALVLLLITFVFFNEAYIAPFVSPGQTVSATPIIGNQTGDVGPEAKIIIPKINLEVPVVFDLGSVREADIQNALEDGVVHFATTPNPGEIGNSVIVGHSSNNILNSGKYKFAFVLLKRLEAEDTFFVHRDGIRYTYKIYKKEVVTPTNLSVLQTQDRPNTMTLITCDPPGTSINRLIITAEQISPDPAGNTESTAPTDLQAEDAEALPSNAPTLWSRLNPFD